MTEKIKLRYITCGIISLLFYICAVIAYTSWENHERMNSLQSEIDRRMIVVARGLKYMMADDFHDRALHGEAISFEEELGNRKALSDFALQTEFKWIYTLAEMDGRFYFSAPTVSEEESQERHSWYFYPYEDIPPEFVHAYNSGQTAFVNYTDRWGVFRSVAVPEESPGGIRYLACADYEISHLEILKKENLRQSVFTAFLFLLGSFPFVLVFWRFFGAATRRLRAMNLELTVHRNHLEERVEARTRELQLANDKLQDEKLKLEKALADVKTLSGMLPICASCKKIRDDKGYWNQIESYIRARSEAQFSHGICPECLEQLYGNDPFLQSLHNS
jgi:hypothetical protein